MRRISLLIAIVGAAILVTSCNAQKHTTQAYYSHKCEYLNHELDGSITVRAYGQGRNRVDARVQARKNAVYQVIFEGVNVPNNPSLSRPLVYEKNAYEKYMHIFKYFFEDDGEYEYFIHKHDKRANTNEKSWGGVQMKVATTITIEREELKAFLIEQQIIKE